MDYFHPRHPAWGKPEQERLELLRNRFPDFHWSDGAEIREQRLPHYPTLPFVIARDAAWEPGNAFVYGLVDDERFVHLNGTSPQIHELNAKGHLKLTNETVLDYISFFCFFVRGEEGPFYVIPSTEAEYLPTSVRVGSDAELSPTQERFRDIYQSTRTFGRAENGNWRVSATVYYSNATFVTDFEVLPTGMVEMKDDTPLMADLPHKIEAPLAPEATRPEKPNGAGTRH